LTTRRTVLAAAVSVPDARDRVRDEVFRPVPVARFRTCRLRDPAAAFRDRRVEVARLVFLAVVLRRFVLAIRPSSLRLSKSVATAQVLQFQEFSGMSFAVCVLGDCSVFWRFR
jgi:hypothetical protein